MNLAVFLLIPFVVAGVSCAGAEGFLNARDFGAKGDGETDDTPAIQKALDTAGENGSAVFLPPGRYRVTDHLNIPMGVALTGSWQAPHHGVWDKGTTLLAYRGKGTEEGPAFIEMNPSTALRGVTIVYPEQDPEDIVPYPWCIRGRGMHVTVENVTLVNPYNGIAIGPEWNELHLIRNVFGCPLRRGLYVDNCTDIGRVENVHWNIHYWHRAYHPNGPKGEGPDQNYRRWVQNNLEAFIFGRTDWESIKDTFTYGARIGYRFVNTGHGAMNGSLLGVGADGCLQAVWVDQIQPMGLLITNGQFAPFRHPSMGPQTSEPRTAAIVTGPGFSGNVTLVNCSFWGGNPIAYLEGARGSHVRFSDCHFRDWAVYDSSLPAIYANGPSLAIRGCTFATSGKEIEIGEKTPGAILTENFSVTELDVNAPEKVEILLGNVVLR